MTDDAAARLHRFRSLVGRAPDGEIAEELGVTVDDVKAYRRANQINPYLRRAPGVAQQRVDPGPRAEDAPAPEPPSAAAAPESPAQHRLEPYRGQLGKVSDHVIAAQAGVKSYIVGEFRRAAGIAAYTGNRFIPGQVPGGAPVRRAVPVASEAAAPPGTTVPGAQTPASAAALPNAIAPRKPRGTRPAKVDGAPAGAVRLEAGAIGVRFTLPPSAADLRRGAGGVARQAVSPAASSAPAAATPAAVPPPAPPPETATEHKFKNGKLTAFHHLMGVEPDAVVAALAQATAGGVKKYRERRGIAAAPVGAPRRERAAAVAPSPVAPPAAVEAPVVVTPAPVSAPAARPPRPSKLDAHRDIVGVLTDGDVAKVAGVTPDGVRKFRDRLGIPASGGAARRRAATPASGREAAVVTKAAAMSRTVPVREVPTAPAPHLQPEPAPVATVAVELHTVALDRTPAPPAVVTSPTRFAFRVVAEAGGESRRFIVVGEHIGEAAMTAVRALAGRDDGPWTVRLMKVLEEALP